jgi:glycosyltransferase involved in cell wall biosynthesis
VKDEETMRPEENMSHNEQSPRMNRDKTDDTPLAERLAAIEASSAWAVARRLSQLRQRLAPEGSWRLDGFRLGLRTVRRIRRLLASLNSTRAEFDAETTGNPPARSHLDRGPDRTGGARVPTERKFRIVFIGSSAVCEAQSMRYRAHNVIAALALAKLEAVFVPQEEILTRFSFILSHDLIVLARMMDNDHVAALIEAARRDAIPVVYDIDDYLFDPWIMPYVEAFRSLRQCDALQAMNLLGGCLHQCDYFTGSTIYLAEKATALGKKSYVLHNGLNAEQIQLSRLAREQRAASPPDGIVRIGYFSGTRTHQADFRIVYPVLMAILRDEANVRLVVVGDLDLGEFPGLASLADHIDLLPLRNWRELPAEIARIDINLIPLELTPFNEGKSNLKYFETGLLKVPSIASPTRILRASITHGHNGLLARTAEEWHDGLKGLVTRADWRERMGQNAFDHVLQNYAPAATADEAVAVYRQIIRNHRTQRGIVEQTLSIVILVHGHENKGNEWEVILRRANELTAAGHAVTLFVSAGERYSSAAELKQCIADAFLEPRFTIQLGGEIPCCDVLMATDTYTVKTAEANARRAHLAVFLAPGDDAVPSATDSSSLPVIHADSRDMDCLLREWVQARPAFAGQLPLAA